VAENSTSRSTQSAGPTSSSVRLVVGPGRVGTVEVPNPSFTYTRGAVPDGEARTVHGAERTLSVNQANRPSAVALSSSAELKRQGDGIDHRGTDPTGDCWPRALQVPPGAAWFAQWSRLDTTLITRATITAPNRYESSAWARAMRRMALVVRLVSDTWNVIPMVRAR
jgi:hypothetical protein